ncbi:uncharacterized protein LOC126881129 [Diabrotica virgifera virgifera]|uniref:Uncharacterized protein n=1 Tax=Diabrotica virgifera virgifera TaxID=50390 RepID=A0ABM5JT82_DIAVI|nr:uncharacterized protein LOC126881129 [Diabrotica virgifera virgifera]
MENNNSKKTNTHNSGDGNSKKYKFYRKPPVRKTIPEVKQTKTSIARLLKANPLLKYENSEIKDNLSVQARTNNYSNKILPIKDNIRPGTQVTTKQDIPRKTLSSLHIEKRKKEFYETSKRGKISNGMKKPLKSILKRRSRSLENFDTKGCYRITEEEDRNGLKEADSQSMHNLSQLYQEPSPLDNGFHISFEFPSLAEMRENVSTPLKKEYDEENKENIEVNILECDSYNDLHIPNDNVDFRKSKELGEHKDKNCNNV